MYAVALVRHRYGEQWGLRENVKGLQETVNARHTRQYELLNEKCREVCQQARHRTLADLMVESGLAEDEGTTLKNEHGQRPISAAQQAAEWERGTNRVDAGRPRRVWLPPLSFTAAFGGRCDFPSLPTVSVVRE